MPGLPHTHLLTLTLEVDFAAMVTIGPVPAGLRRIAPVTGGSFTGDRIAGTVEPGADWVISRSDGVMVIDVRLVLRTEDGTPIYLTYQGRFLASSEVMARFGRGEQLSPKDYSLVVTAKFECGDPRHAWLNDTVAIGIGEQLRGGVRYTIFAIG